MFLSARVCRTNNITNCKTQSQDEKCNECSEGSVLVMGKCPTINDINCLSYDSNKHKCNGCDETQYYRDQEGCLSRMGSIYQNCKQPKTSTNECFECEEGYELIDGECHEIEEEETKKKASSEIEDNCLERSVRGCLRCEDGYYLYDSTCIQCQYPGESCWNATYCTSCDSYSNLVNGTCISMNKLIKTCDNVWPNNQGCIKCKDGYYKAEDGRNCEECDISCKTCLNKDTCLTCIEHYYIIPESTYHLCKHFNESIGCVNITQSGCIHCQDGMYLTNYECFNCPNECLTCWNNYQCQPCPNEYVLKEHQCIHYSQIEHCESASNSVCQQCSNGYELNTNRNECHYKINIGLTIGIIVGILVLIVAIFYHHSIHHIENNW